MRLRIICTSISAVADANADLLRHIIYITINYKLLSDEFQPHLYSCTKLVISSVRRSCDRRIEGTDIREGKWRKGKQTVKEAR